MSAKTPRRDLRVVLFLFRSHAIPHVRQRLPLNHETEQAVRELKTGGKACTVYTTRRACKEENSFLRADHHGAMLPVSDKYPVMVFLLLYDIIAPPTCRPGTETDSSWFEIRLCLPHYSTLLDNWSISQAIRHSPSSASVERSRETHCCETAR